MTLEQINLFTLLSKLGITPSITVCSFDGTAFSNWYLPMMPHDDGYKEFFENKRKNYVV